MPVDRKSMRDAIVAEDDRTMRAKPKAKAVEPLPERTRPRGLEGHGFSGAETRAIQKMADGGTPRTDIAPPKTAQDMLDRLQRGKGY